MLIFVNLDSRLGGNDIIRGKDINSDLINENSYKEKL